MRAPRETFVFVGHAEAEAELAQALTSRRMHHAWLITGPQGVGKATLAFRAARVALGAKSIGPRPLDVSSDDQIAKRMAAGSHPDFFLLERGLNERGKLRREISADDARQLPGFFTLGSTDGGMRVAIVDAVDDLNRHAANALLKTLEEPPARTLLLLVCHSPGAALATIRSRCRRLDLRPLSDADMAKVVAADGEVLRLAAGRPGRALALQGEGALAQEIAAALARLDKDGANALLPLALVRGGDARERMNLVLDAVQDWVRRAVLQASGAPQDGLDTKVAAAMARAAPAARAAVWAEAYSDLETLRGEADELDLDPTHALARAALILDRAVARP